MFPPTTEVELPLEVFETPSPTHAPKVAVLWLPPLTELLAPLARLPIPSEIVSANGLAKALQSFAFGLGPVNPTAAKALSRSSASGWERDGGVIERVAFAFADHVQR